MKNWIHILPEDIHPYFEPGQLKTLQEFLILQGYQDPLPETINDVILYIHYHLKAKFNIPDSIKTIPPGFKPIACMLIMDRLAAILPSITLTKDQTRRINDCHKFLTHSLKAIHHLNNHQESIIHTSRLSKSKHKS